MNHGFDPDDVVCRPYHFVGGERVPAAGEIDLFRPSDGVGFAATPVAGPDLVDRAVTVAAAAQKRSGWATARPRERVDAMRRWADLVAAEATDLARLEAVASTRPIGELLSADIPIMAEQIRFFGEFADKEGGDLVPTARDALGLVASEPYGVVGAIAPWNVPLSMAVWKLAPALAAGNAVVLKPSELTPFATLRLVELSVAAGIPPGLVNVVNGDGRTTGAALVAHPGVAKVSFTGSTAAGAAIMETVARSGVKPVTLELGGKSPQLVFADADLDRTAAVVARSILANAGQACVAGSRLIVEAAVADDFVDRVAVAMAAARPGPTWDPATTFPPIVSERQRGRIDDLVGAALAAGARRRLGGRPLDRPGFFYAPTILEGCGSGSPAVREEIFGPVLTVETFRDEAEALALADHPVYGLCAGVHTRDLSRAVRVAAAVQAGTVWVNRYGRSRDHILPTGGYKGSGVGKDLGREAYRANRRQKSILIDIRPEDAA